MLINPLLGPNKDSPLSVNDLEITDISIEKAKAFNAKYHSRLPKYPLNISKHCFAMVFKNQIYSIAIWRNPFCANLPQDSWLELARLAISPEAPRNTASKFISLMVKQLRPMGKYAKLISYQDCEVHTGTIYKASNWHIGFSYRRKRNWKRKGRTNTDVNAVFSHKN